MPQNDALISNEVACRLLMIDVATFKKLVRDGYLAPEPGYRPAKYHPVKITQGYIKHLRELASPDRELTGSDLAASLCCDYDTVKDYVVRGVIQKLPSGKYREAECRQKVFAHLRDTAGGRTGNSGDNLASARAELAKEQRESVAFKNAIARGEYVHVDDLIREVGSMIAVTRERFLSIPGVTAPHLHGLSVAEIEDLLIEKISEAMDELAQPAQWDRGS